MSIEKDYLELGKHPSISKLLAHDEVIHFSDMIVKINRKSKQQERAILITDRNIFNLVITKAALKSKRKIEISKVVAIIWGKEGKEFVVKVPEEYDYHYKSVKREEIIAVIEKILKVSFQQDLTKVQQDNIIPLEHIVKKTDRGQQTREDILKKAQAIAAVETKSDEEDRNEVAKSATDITEHDLLNTGQKVGISDFELLKVLGRGAFGKVMQVRKKDGGQVFAMKILKKAAIIGRNQVEHTKAERKILETLQHPFLMTLRFAFQSKEKLYLVLDYYQGGELFFHLKDQRRFSEEVARIYVAEIAMAFGHLHSHDIIYRDLKPENILLDNDGHVCLTDFGLAKEVKKGESTQTFCGTPEYLAPEIICANGHDKAVDWWSLGILLYELTVGIPPFYSQNVNEMYQKIQQGVLRFPPFLSEECKSLIVGLLNRKPDERLGSVNDFDDVKDHAFFQGLKNHAYFTTGNSEKMEMWDAVFGKKLNPAFKPQVDDIEDVRNFDEEFLNEPVVDSVVPNAPFQQNNQEVFTGFTYKGAGGHLS